MSTIKYALFANVSTVAFSRLSPQNLLPLYDNSSVSCGENIGLNYGILFSSHVAASL